jgi:outer membrane protein OmpA-like peptidoglycan-associated protein
MSSHSKGRLGRVFVMLSAMMVVLSVLGALTAAQDRPAPKVELFGGYSFWDPGATVSGILPEGVSPLSSTLESNPRGAGVSATYNFNHWLGLTLDTSTDWGSGESGVANRLDDAAFSNLSLGPKATFRHKHFSPFLEVLVGDQRLMPDGFHDIDKLGFMAGGGLDINLSRHIALRLIRADFVYSNYQYGSSAVNPSTDLRGVRLQTGLNFMFGGGHAPAPATAACLAEPSEVFAGEPVSGTATGSNFNPKRTIRYNWSGTGVKEASNNASTSIDTTGFQTGSYQVSAELRDGSKRGVASCLARFTVKQARPPEIACSSIPGTITTGGTSTIRSKANSPDNRRLTYSYSANSGKVSGTDATATLNTADTGPGPITVTCTASNDRNPALTASAMTTVTVEAPPSPPPPAPSPDINELEMRLALHSIYFQTARPTEKNPNSGLVESQQVVVISLASDFNKYLKFKPDAHLILGGHADSRGSAEYNKALTERRVSRTKSILVEHGVPAGSIDVQSFGKEDALNAEQVKQQMQENPDLSSDDRQQMLNNLQVIVLANNRRVDVSLTTTGQQSVRRYPFNAKDALALISAKGVVKEPVTKKAPKKP